MVNVHNVCIAYPDVWNKRLDKFFSFAIVGITALRYRDVP